MPVQHFFIDDGCRLLIKMSAEQDTANSPVPEMWFRGGWMKFEGPANRTDARDNREERLERSGGWNGFWKEGNRLIRDDQYF